MALTAGENGDGELLGQLFRCLQSGTRRQVLFELLDHNPREAYLVPEDVHRGDGDIDRLDLALTHTHLPVLEDAGLIRWDRQGNELHEGSNFSEVRDVLLCIREQLSQRPEK